MHCPITGASDEGLLCAKMTNHYKKYSYFIILSKKTDINMAMTWYTNGMKITIDRAGRVVIPSSIRSKAGLLPGCEIEVTYEDGSIKLVRCVSRPDIVRTNSRLVARPSAPPEQRPRMDAAELVEEERNRCP